MPPPTMAYGEFLLRTRAGAFRQLLAIEAQALAQGGSETRVQLRFTELKEMADGG